MLTPQEVSERAFSKASFGGYNMSQVDEFLDILTGDYTALYNENAVLKSKMKVLVEKVEEYRSTEEAMRKALMTAQRMADELIREAEEKKADILRRAESDVRTRMDALSSEVRAEEYRLEQAKQATCGFVEKVRALMAGQEDYLSKLQQLVPAAPPPPDQVEQTVSEIDDNVQRLLAQAMKEAAEETLRARQEEEEETDDLSDTAEFQLTGEEEEEFPEEEPEDPPQGRKIDFGALQFGRDYEIK